MPQHLDPKIKAQQLRKTFGDNANKVVDQIVKYAPKRPFAQDSDPMSYFRKVKEHLDHFKTHGSFNLKNTKE